MSDDNALPERLRVRLQDPKFKGLVDWIGLEISLYGGDRRFRRVVSKFPDELLAAALQEHVRHCAELSCLFEGDALAAIVSRVMGSNDTVAWKSLATARPELAGLIQEELIRVATETNSNGDLRHREMAKYLTIGYFEAFLREVPGTNPVPVQHLLMHRRNNYGGELVDLTIRLPQRTSLFATISLLLLKCESDVGRHLDALCKARPEAVPMLQTCLQNVGVIPNTFVAVCTKVPGMDLDELEEFALTHWSRQYQQLFCTNVKRERGPLRDWLAVEYVMES